MMFFETNYSVTVLFGVMYVKYVLKNKSKCNNKINRNLEISKNTYACK